jgi:hypothetical protein
VAARLKVFVTSDGLTEYVVAASSKPKALAAWGAHQDLFKTGGARETDDPELTKAALAQPGEVLRRPADAAGALASALKAVKRPPRPKAPSKAALKRVKALEEQLETLDDAHEAALERIAQARADLDRQEAREIERHETRRAKLEDDLANARRAVSA